MLSDLEREKAIKRELAKYKRMFKDEDPDKKTFAERLYSQAVFMQFTLDELQEKIKTEGAIVEAVNGNGFETRTEHPAQKSYNSMIRNYNATIKNLIDMLSKKEGKDDELMEFLDKKKRK